MDGEQELKVEDVCQGHALWLASSTLPKPPHSSQLTGNSGS